MTERLTPEWIAELRRGCDFATRWWGDDRTMNVTAGELLILLDAAEENVRLRDALDYALWAADPTGSWTDSETPDDTHVPEWVSRAWAVLRSKNDAGL